MAVVKPLRALRYNVEKIKSLSEVVVPPYDVISPVELEELKRGNKFNFSNIILAGEDDGHEASASRLKAWQKEDVLKQDPSECLYFYEQTFKLDRYELFCQNVPDAVRAGGVLSRTGLFCRVGLEDYSAKIILPHEKTFSGPKADRYKLMEATEGNMEPVFLGYDSERFSGDEFEKILLNVKPTVQYVDQFEVEHRLWAVSDVRVHELVEKVLALQKFYILDGHHRYETALQFYKDHQKSDARLSHRFVLADICSFKQPGTVILPTHRLISGVPHGKIDTALAAIKSDFDFMTVDSFDVLEKMMSEFKGTCFGFKFNGGSGFEFMSVKRDSSLANPPQLDLDVLHGSVLAKFYSEDGAAIRPPHLPKPASSGEESLTISYVKSIPEWEQKLETGEFQFGFLVKPTTCDEVMNVALNGKKMPHKSTFFYPKIPSGLVINLFE